MKRDDTEQALAALRKEVGLHKKQISLLACAVSELIKLVEPTGLGAVKKMMSENT